MLQNKAHRSVSMREVCHTLLLHALFYRFHDLDQLFSVLPGSDSIKKIAHSLDIQVKGTMTPSKPSDALCFVKGDIQFLAKGPLPNELKKLPEGILRGASRAMSDIIINQVLHIWSMPSWGRTNASVGVNAEDWIHEHLAQKNLLICLCNVCDVFSNSGIWQVWGACSCSLQWMGYKSVAKIDDSRI